MLCRDSLLVISRALEPNTAVTIRSDTTEVEGLGFRKRLKVDDQDGEMGLPMSTETCPRLEPLGKATSTIVTGCHVSKLVEPNLVRRLCRAQSVSCCHSMTTDSNTPFTEERGPVIKPRMLPRVATSASTPKDNRITREHAKDHQRPRLKGH